MVFVKKQARGRGKGTDGECHTAAEVNLKLGGVRRLGETERERNGSWGSLGP